MLEWNTLAFFVIPKIEGGGCCGRRGLERSEAGGSKRNGDRRGRIGGGKGRIRDRVSVV